MSETLAASHAFDIASPRRDDIVYLDYQSSKPVEPVTIVSIRRKAGGEAKATDAAPPDEISDDEFEALLDDLHGKGKHTGAPAKKEAAAKKAGLVEKRTEEQVSDILRGKGW